MEGKQELSALFLLSYFVTVSHCMAQASLELTTLLLGLMSSGITDLGRQSQLPSLPSQIFLKQ